MTETTLTPWTSVSAALARARGLDDQELVDRLQDLSVQIRALQAQQAAVVAEIESRICALGYPMSGAAETVAVTLAMSPRSAEHLLGVSVALCDREVVWVALAQGRVDMTKARAILDELADIPDPRREDLELAALAYAETHTTHQLRKRLLAMTCAGDNDPDTSLRQRALDNRGVSIYQRGHGMADVCASLSAEQAEAFIQALDTLAAGQDCADPYQQGTDRSLDQRRADALVGFLDQHCTWDIHVDVIIDADTLIGDNQCTADSRRMGPVTSELARRLAWSPDARWRRLVTDPMTGRLLDLSTDAYRIPQKIKTVVKARDLTCRFPGCHRDAQYADCDHINPWPAGKTTLANLAGLCRHHHRVKTHSAWRVRHDPARPTHDLTWTSPLGTQHTTTAHNYHPRD